MIETALDIQRRNAIGDARFREHYEPLIDRCLELMRERELKP